MSTGLRQLVLRTFEQKPKLNKCVYCGKPAQKKTCGGYECRRKYKADYCKKNAKKAVKN